MASGGRTSRRTAVPASSMRGSGLHIRLLGSPEITREEERAAPPKGRKTWAVLAFLLLNDSRPSRSRLAELCFPQADDPRAALRWALADLRRLLDEGDVAGDPVQLVLPLDTVVDVWQVVGGTPGAEQACRRGELLEGLTFRSSEPLERWLTLERRRLAVRCSDVLAAAIDEAEASGGAAEASHLAAQLVALEPYPHPDQPRPLRGDRPTARSARAAPDRREHPPHPLHPRGEFGQLPER